VGAGNERRYSVFAHWLAIVLWYWLTYSLAFVWEPSLPKKVAFLPHLRNNMGDISHITHLVCFVALVVWKPQLDY
jgi:hypothetical protein